MPLGLEFVNSPQKRVILVPFSGAGSSVPAGSGVMRGVTAGTNKGVAIPFTAASNARCLGILTDAHNYALSGDALTQTLVSWFPNGVLATGATAFPSHGVEIASSAVIMRADYALTNPTGVAVASSTSTVITITSTEADLDSGFAYAYGGTGIGQLEFIKSSTTGAWTIISAMTTTFDATTTLLKILPMFYDTPTWLVPGSGTTPPGTSLDSIAAIGTGRAVNLGNFIEMNNGAGQRMDPKVFHNYQKLNNLTTLAFYSLAALVDTAFTPIV